MVILRSWIGHSRGGAHPNKNQKNQKKTKKTKPIYQFWCSDWFFLGFFGFFLVFSGIFWDDILTLNLNTKKTKKSQKIPKKPKKNQRSPKNQFPISDVGQGLCQKKPKKAKKPKKPKKTVYNFEFWPKPMPKKTKKKPKKTKKNQCQFGNLKKPKKTKKNQCQFTDFGVATGFFWVSTPPPPFHRTGLTGEGIRTLERVYETRSAQ